MKKNLLLVSLLAVMSASAFAQTTPAPSKPTTAVSGVAVPPGTKAAAPVRLGPDPDQMAKQQIARFDTNKDGKVSLDEFLKPAKDSFKRTDANNDGFVTAEELVAFNKRQMEEFMKTRGIPHSPTAPAKAVAPVKAVAPAAQEKPAK